MRAAALLLFLAAHPALHPAVAEDAVAVAFLSQIRPSARPTSPLDRETKDEGLAGARLGLADVATTGRFTGQRFALAERTITTGEDAAAVMHELKAQGIRFVVADLDASILRTVAAAPEAQDILILNSRAPDDALRGEACRPNLLHVALSRAMLADALAQHLVAKRWRRWFLVVGREPGDTLLAEAYRRAAKRFGAEIVAEKEWTF